MIFELAGDLADALDAIPNGHPRDRLLKLLDEAVRRDIHFIARHRQDYPQALFQCAWNNGWWYDSPEAAQYYEDEYAPSPAIEPKLCELIELWRSENEGQALQKPWLRSRRPPPLHLGTAQAAVLAGHEASVLDVAISPNGMLIASGASDGTIRIWDRASARELFVLLGHDEGVNVVEFSPDGRSLASGSDDTTIRLWSVESGDEIAIFSDKPYNITCLAFSPDGSRIVSGSADNFVQLWNVPRSSLDACFPGHEEGVTCVAFSADGRRLLSGSFDHTVRVWALDGAASTVLTMTSEGWLTTVIRDVFAGRQPDSDGGRPRLANLGPVYGSLVGEDGCHEIHVEGDVCARRTTYRLRRLVRESARAGGGDGQDGRNSQGRR